MYTQYITYLEEILTNKLIFFLIINIKLHRLSILPTLEQFEAGRANVLAYTTFIDRFVQSVVGFNIFRKNCAVNKYSEYASVSDEAMAYLILASNWDSLE